MDWGKEQDDEDERGKGHLFRRRGFQGVPGGRRGRQRGGNVMLGGN